ncbi:hypothetical protein CLOBOL_01141 [Enterocloster bolteae ATCC BAA-613]|uniref:Uncharacterized protein n=1 Tax=Enterocloster bolteae (strain ATCC BAA-613 / DSM 15670 / CCUG 46953 / JCM 12243 / WAL 16351) TaxID=411902 RepID=A8RJ93_ENTBW|nr:hypothetical protein CLOBOL_01141 [Enterocloster bolteae ATCC BAA-613]
MYENVDRWLTDVCLTDTFYRKYSEPGGYYEAICRDD